MACLVLLRLWLQLMCPVLVRRRIDSLLINSSCGTDWWTGWVWTAAQLFGALSACPKKNQKNKRKPKSGPTRWNRLYGWSCGAAPESWMKCFNSGSGSEFHPMWVLICGWSINAVVQHYGEMHSHSRCTKRPPSWLPAETWSVLSRRHKHRKGDINDDFRRNTGNKWT